MFNKVLSFVHKSCCGFFCLFFLSLWAAIIARGEESLWDYETDPIYSLEEIASLILVWKICYQFHFHI